MIKGLSGLNTNFTHRLLQINQSNLNKSLEKLSSGMRINSASDDAAGLAILARMNTQVNGNGQAMYNIQDTYSATQVAEGGMEQIGDMQQSLRTLAVQASNDTLTNDDRAMLQEEADQLVQEIDRMTDTVTFNGQKLLNGDYAAGTDDLTTQAGANEGETVNVNFEKVDTASLGIDSIDISTRAGAEDAISKLDQGIQSLSEQRANIGAYQNRLESSYNFAGIQQENQMSSASRIGDTDMALEMINYTKNSLLTNSNFAMLAQGNLSQRGALTLLQGLA